MKLDLDNSNVFEHEMTVDQVRKLEIDNDGVAAVFDNAQGFVFSDEGPIAYLVIKITKS